MYKFTVLVLLLLLFGCKKPEKAVIAPPVKMYKNEMKGQAIDSMSLLAFKDSILYAFYETHGYETIWSNPKIRHAAIEILRASAAEGLEPADYKVETLDQLENRIDSLSVKELINYDVQLSLSLQKYLSHLYNGKVSPRRLYRDWDLKRTYVNLNVLLSDGILGDSLSAVFKNATPSHQMYKNLKSALQLVDAFPKDDVPAIYTGDVKIVKKDSVAAVRDIKKRLMYWGDLKRQDTLTSIYDAETYNAVKRFQFRHGLSADGVIGKGTIAALNFTKQQRKEQIIANLERWRWFPRNLTAHYLIINIPSYNLTIVKAGDTIAEKRVVVGKIGRKTPILSSTFNSIVFNPTWTVPPTILREDLLPSAIKNRNYFIEREITIYDWKKNIVPPELWNPEKSTSYRYVQAPGEQNSLGKVKFNFPNHFTVYLHDTNHRDVFSRSYRSLSSGCVRVEDPLPLAAYLLEDMKRWSIDSIQKVIATNETKIIALRQKVRIHQLYWTAWSENKKLIFRDDIYQLDEALYDALRYKR